MNQTALSPPASADTNSLCRERPYEQRCNLTWKVPCFEERRLCSQVLWPKGIDPGLRKPLVPIIGSETVPGPNLIPFTTCNPHHWCQPTPTPGPADDPPVTSKTAFQLMFFTFPIPTSLLLLRVTHRIHELAHFRLCEPAPLALEAVPELLKRDGAAVVRIHGLEHLLQPLDLFWRHALRNYLQI